MHEAFRRRLEALEDARKNRLELFTMIIRFVNGDGTRVEAKHCWELGSQFDSQFEIDRREDEDEEAFMARADQEARAAVPGPWVLMFGDPKQEAADAA
jgi:hypothetical protein